MIPRIAMALGAVSVGVPAFRRRQAPALSLRSIAGWLAPRRESCLIAAILLIAGLAHGINMFHFPYFEDDEGVYMSQAWSVLTDGQLAPYTYWYDHAPAGWFLLAIYTTLIHGFHVFGSAVETGRVLMLGVQIVSTYLLYRIGQRMSGSALVGAMAALLFALSPFAIYYHRRVLLDNITTVWMLTSVLLLLAVPLRLKHVWLSALAFGISVLSKENTILLFPALVYLVYYRTTVVRRAFAIGTWITVSASVISLYILLALLKGELFPEGTLLGGTNPHVSLIGTLQYQANRKKDGGLLDLNSAFYHWMSHWAHAEPLLIVGGMGCALLLLLLFRWQRMTGVAGLMTLCMTVFLARGGEVIEFYVVPLLPLLALNVALTFGLVTRWLQQPGGRVPGPVLAALRALRLLVAGAIISLIGLGYTTPWQGLVNHHLLLWNGTQADAQQQAVAWVRAHVPPTAHIITDDYLYTDLHDGANGTPAYPRADWYQKVGLDPAIQDAIYHNNWRNLDYIIATPQLVLDARGEQLALVAPTLAHARTVAHFDTGGWQVNVMEVMKPGAPALGALPYQRAARQFLFAGAVNTPAQRSTIQLINPGVLPASVTITFYLPNGTLDVQRVQVDASSQLQVRIVDLLRVNGRLGVRVQASRPVGASLVVSSAQGAIQGIDSGVSNRWTLLARGAAQQGRATLDVLNPQTRATDTLVTFRGAGGIVESMRARIQPRAERSFTLERLKSGTEVSVRSSLAVTVHESVARALSRSRPATITAVSGDGATMSTVRTVENGFCSATTIAIGSGRPMLAGAYCRNGEDVRSFLHANRLSGVTRGS